jgi:two-component system OmpR family response regulator
MEVLIIDDNEQITTMLSKFLKLEGMACTVSNSGRNGLEIIQKKEWGGVLLDLTMPEFSGYDVLEALEKDDMIKSKNIILFTATEISDQQIEEWKGKGVKSVLRKPVDVDLLLKVVNNNLD